MQVAMIILGIIGLVFFTPLFVAYWLCRFAIWVVQSCYKAFCEQEQEKEKEKEKGSPKAED